MNKNKNEGEGEGSSSLGMIIGIVVGVVVIIILVVLFFNKLLCNRSKDKIDKKVALPEVGLAGAQIKMKEGFSK